VPPEYLVQMFGPRVERAMETYRQIKDDPEMLGVFVLMGATDRWIEKFRVKGDEVMGYDAKGDEIARVPLKEPIFIRPNFDPVQQVFRHNTS
jgi:nitrate reductase beta subunit